MELDIAGEDEVTRTVIERLVTEYRKDIIIRTRHPARGGQLKKDGPKYNAVDFPVFLLTDLDNCDCAPQLIRDWFGETPISNSMLFRVAYDEAEAWLMADREGFSKWLGIDGRLVPEAQVIDRRKQIFEPRFPYKASLYMMRDLVSKSKRKDLVDGLSPTKGAGKGPAYNATLIPFIRDMWDIQNAAKNSFSLATTIERLKAFAPY